MKKYVTKYWFPGSFFAEESDVEGEFTGTWPDHAYSCQQYVWEEKVIDGKTFRTDRQKLGKLIYRRGSTVTTLKEVEKGKAPGRVTDTLIRNMKGNRWDKIVWTYAGSWPQKWDPETMEIEP